ncbi:Uncharacterised protein [Fusobacterium polymorphum]|uniref:Polysaccharide chain length determinant N-terminal domain-containing protein n=1 Tax=Fusobacterium polymorphum ATCC 10953 TaxID=393480 RepID=A5TVH7_FUSNP|nr:hypothetical protein [Fusobacterium polymorphum]EDK88902.1 hypothetical protein FNP_1115 [Fusobacterium polymorphum ATCC 10953]UTI53387.1 hypothetical protein NLJ26_01855 [Fusobacterium polymorphum]WRL67909.1 hypothetical protein VKN78_08890 [Fusobacterium polymorphum]CKG69466.1 Uncharacterised protein [Fusobacterium polymorphum]
MQNNLMKMEDEFYEENEINIYDLINIFLKNIKLFIKVTILGLIITCLYIGVRIIFFKNNILYINYTLNYEEINSYIGKDIYYPKKSPKEILLDNKYIDLLFENPELKALYEEKVKEERDNVNTKRQFLINNKVLETLSIKELTKNKDEQELISPDSYRTTVRINRRNDSGKKVSDSVMTTYLDILNQYYKENMFDYLAERKKYLEKTLPVLKKQLEENAVSGNIPIKSGGTGTAENNYFKYIYPIQVSNIDTYYEKYKTLETEYQAIKTLFDLELNKTENFIKYDSSIIIEKEKSGNFVKLGIGIFLSLCLGILATFIKEFFEGYKKNKKAL